MDQNVPVCQRIAGAAEALSAATRFRDLFAAGAAGRDRHRTLPHDEVAALSTSGLWAITVPAAHGGIDVAHAVLAEVTALLAEGDPSIAQIPQNHFSTLETLRHIAGARQQAELFAAVLAGARFGNAEAERGPPATTLRRDGGGWRLDGRKAYSTGALFADLITVTARDPDGQAMLAIVGRDAPGLSVVDDWSGMGQRTTASGTTILDGVRVAADRVMSLQPAFGRRSPVGAIAQLLHAAIDLGIARAALREAGCFVRERSRPFADAGVTRACDDPLLLERFGRLQVQVHAAEALLHRGAAALDAARAEPGEDAYAAASIAVAEAKALTTEAALAAASGLFELAGTSSSLSAHNLDRFWRDARTHTLHDPVRWKYHAIGNFFVNGEKPPIRSYL
jgi:SfnB family sulfur acquisition oxidoreductase